VLFGPRAAAWALAAVFAVGVAGAVYSIPVQRSESLEIIEAVQNVPSVGAALAGGFRASTSWLRPLRYAHAKALLSTAQALGRSYNVVYRGYHALLVAALMLLFVAAARPSAWIEVAAFAFALTVLTGMDTFAAMLREAYPVNHFLVIAIATLTAVVLASTHGGAAADIGAVVALSIALLTLESGMVVWVVAFCGYVAGLRGISRTGLATMSLVLVGYLAVRMGYYHLGGNPLGERETGLWLRMLSPEEQVRGFAANPWPFYAYTASSSFLNILVSQPVLGQWTAVNAYLDGQLQPVFVVEVTTSLVATAVIGWYGWYRRHAIVLVAFGALLMSALLSYAYAKNEIMSAAGVVYALAVYFAFAELLRLLSAKTTRRSAIPNVLLVAAVSVGWGGRALGLQYSLQRAAYKARNEWVSLAPDGEPEPSSSAMASRLRDEALLRGASNPGMLPRLATAYWGDD
jgi:hypothetical protein